MDTTRIAMVVMVKVIRLLLAHLSKGSILLRRLAIISHSLV